MYIHVYICAYVYTHILRGVGIPGVGCFGLYVGVLGYTYVYCIYHHTYTCICTYVYIYRYICIYTIMCIYMLFPRVRLWCVGTFCGGGICTYISCMHIYIYMYVHIHIGLHVYIYTYTCVYIYIYIRVYTNESSEVHEPKTVSGSVDSIKVSSDKM